MTTPVASVTTLVLITTTQPVDGATTPAEALRVAQADPQGLGGLGDAARTWAHGVRGAVIEGCPHARVTQVVALPAPGGAARLLGQLVTVVDVLTLVMAGDPRAQALAAALLTEPTEQGEPDA